MNSEIKVILFDLGNVLMPIDFDAFPNALGIAMPEWRLKYESKRNELVRLYESGKISTEEFLDTLYVMFDAKFSREKILASYETIIVKDNTAIIPIVEKVKKQFRVAVLSNIGECHWKKVHRDSSVTKLFPHFFASFQIGEMKPAAKVYQHVCTSLGVKPEEVIFIDDVNENIEGAIAFGMKGIVYTTAVQIERELLELHII